MVLPMDGSSAASSLMPIPKDSFYFKSYFTVRVHAADKRFHCEVLYVVWCLPIQNFMSK